MVKLCTRRTVQFRLVFRKELCKILATTLLLRRGSHGPFCPHYTVDCQKGQGRKGIKVQGIKAFWGPGNNHKNSRNY